MGDLGRNCATKNRKVIQVTIIRKRKHERLDDYIGSEIRKTQRGARLDRDGDRLIITREGRSQRVDVPLARSIHRDPQARRSAIFPELFHHPKDGLRPCGGW